MSDPTKAIACPSHDELRAFNVGDLPDDVLEDIADHVSSCQSCERLIETDDSADPTLIAMLRMMDRTSKVRNLEVLGEPSCRFLHSRLTKLGFSRLRDLQPASEEGISTATHSVANSWANGKPDSANDNNETSSVPEKIGHYFVLRELGRGGFSRVYLARDPEKDQFVAIKVPRQDRATSEKHIQRFLDEARTAAEMDHPGIVPVYDWGRDQHGSCFVVMKYIEGRSLGEMQATEKLTHRDAVRLVSSVAEALHYAHTHGIVHRDVKPANVIVDKQGQAHVMDFGLAFNEQTEMLIGGDMAGTYPYMSPEQLSGDRTRIDSRTDIWSLGVVLYELLTRQRPFGGRSAKAICRAILTNEPKALRQVDEEVPVELEQICLRALDKDKAARFSTARDFADALNRWLAPGKSKHWWVAAGSLAAVLLLVLAAIAGVAIKRANFRSTIASGGNSDSFRSRPMVGMDLLERSPTELVNEFNDAWTYDKGKRLVELATRDGFILLEVNRTDFHPYRLEVTFDKIEPAYLEGHFSFGIFFGLHSDQLPEGIACEKYQILRLVRTREANQYVLERINSLHYTDQFGSLVSSDGPVEAQEERILVNNDLRDVLTLDVGRRGLEHVTWRGQEMRRLTVPEINELTTTSDYEGAMGILLQRGQVRVRSVSFRYLGEQE